MKLIHGIHHKPKRSLEDFLVRTFQFVIVTMILCIVAFVAADAFVKEDIARVKKLQEHIYGVTEQRSYAVPNPHDLANPKTRVFSGRGK